MHSCPAFHFVNILTSRIGADEPIAGARLGFGKAFRIRGFLGAALLLSALGTPSFAKQPVKRHVPFLERFPRDRHARPAMRLPPISVVPLKVVVPPTQNPNEDLASALERAYRNNPILAAKRYDLQAIDENYAQARAELRATSQIQVTGEYDRTAPGRTTRASRPLIDRLRSNTIVRNSLGAELIVDQPLLTSGKASADISAAQAEIRGGREVMRGVEGDLLLQVIAAYVDVRRDTRSLEIRQTSLERLEATRDEISARRRAGQFTLTDVAQAEAQLQAAVVQANQAQEQLEQDRASYAMLVGASPGILESEPPLPLLPRTIEAAFATAAKFNPELAGALFAEAASRERIAAARSAGKPSLNLRGTASLTGKAVPFHLYNEDQGFSGRAILTIPLLSGGRTTSLVAQAQHRNSADRLRIEAARRLLVQNIVNAWNQAITAEQNMGVISDQLEAARIFNEGTLAEYRAGLRSTFDVLFAQNSLRDTELAQLGTKRDVYLAQATLLRHLGVLEVGSILTGTGIYDPSDHVRQIERRTELLWYPTLRTLDRLDRPRGRQERLIAPEHVPTRPQMVQPTSVDPGTEEGDIETVGPVVPFPGTTAQLKIRKRP